MTVLCIDPGNRASGWALVARGPTLLQCGKDPNPRVRALVREGTFESLLLERIQSYGKPVGYSIFSTVEWLGRFWECAATRKLPVHCFYRPQVFRAVTGCTRGGDPVLRRVLTLRFGREVADKLAAKAGSDTWSAFALGVYYWDHLRLNGNPNGNLCL